MSMWTSRIVSFNSIVEFKEWWVVNIKENNKNWNSLKHDNSYDLVVKFYLKN